MGGTFGKSGSWVVDHKLDGIPLRPMDDNGDDSDDDSTPRHGSIATITGGPDPPAYAKDPISLVESPEDKKARKRSHYIVYTTMFIMSIGFSIVLSGAWPYLQQLVDGLTKDYLGLIVAANPLGQLVASPILGWWGNRVGSIRVACLLSVLLFIFGNMMYAFLNVFEAWGEMWPYYMMFVSRFIVGLSSGNVTLCRSYLAESTTLKERTTGIALISAAQAFGFVVGPGIQTVLTLAIPEPIDTGSDWFIFDKFTSTGWVGAILGLLNLIILMPCVFQEYNISRKEREMMKQDDQEDMKLPRADYTAVVGVLYGFFMGQFVYVLIETLMEPLMQDQYAWDEDKAMVVVGIALMAGGTLAAALFPTSGPLSKKIDERKIMLFCGFIPLLVGSLLFIPFAGKDLIIMNCTETTESSTFTTSASTTLVPFSSTTEWPEEDCNEFGCPPDQEWCNDVPQLPLPQLIIGFLFLMGGYPMTMANCQALFSKMLGPRPQGVWMGILTGVGSFARVVGPFFVSLVYARLGTRYCFCIIVLGMILAMIELSLLYRRLVPMKIPSRRELKGHDGPAADKY